MNTNQTCACGKSGKCFHITTIVLLVIAIAATIWAGCQVTKMETLKVGGKENFAKLQTIMKSNEYKEQYAQSLDLMLQQLNGGLANDNLSGGEEIIIDKPATSGENIEVTVDPSSTGETVINTIDQNEVAGE